MPGHRALRVRSPQARTRRSHDPQQPPDLCAARSDAWRPPTPPCAPPPCAAARAAHHPAHRHKLVLPAICLLTEDLNPNRFTQDLGHDLAIRAVLVHRRVGLDLRAINRDHPHRHQPRLPTQPQHIIKQPGDLGLMPAAELRDRRVIRTALIHRLRGARRPRLIGAPATPSSRTARPRVPLPGSAAGCPVFVGI